eukprot:TRINITY_DN6225_c0_g1_i1.p1 TRINITY_DN6225_c0_g1~~TRINITY_DN6225_c0_g1_i1.p1  ORF type:complete len:719 (+),score=219.52 TRINITY_DN6225_c0_g1_i1:77-2158(+)
MASAAERLQVARRELGALCSKVAELEQAAAEEADAQCGPAALVSGQRGAAGMADPVPDGFVKVVEGTAAVLEAKRAADPASPEKAAQQEVFYNPVQVVNRDLSVLMIRCYDALRKGPGRVRRGGRPPDKGLRILEALSATGLRAVRYWKEIPGIDQLVANDIDPSAVEAIRRNLRYNGVPLSRVVANCDDAVHLMHRLAMPTVPGQQLARACGGGEAALLMHGQRMDVVDLDPYGTAAPFLDAAVQCCEEGGLLCVTCTDSDVLCGVHTEVAHHKYGALTVRAKHCHEMAVRVLLGCIERHAIRHGRHIKPLLSMHIDFYARVFVRVLGSRAEAKLSIGKLGHLVQCSACAAFWVRPIGTVRADEPGGSPGGGGGRKRRKLRHQEKSAASAGAAAAPAAEAAVAPAEAADTPAEVGPATFTAALPPLPPREHPRIKYVTSNCSVLHCTAAPAESPALSACSVCGHTQWLGGPIWARELHDSQYVSGMIEHLDAHKDEFSAHQRVRALLAAARDELPDCPLFYHIPAICSSLKGQTIQAAALCSALTALGYRVSQVHCDPSGVKTDAPPEVVYDVMRCWIREEPKRTAVSGDVLPPKGAGPPAEYGCAKRTPHPAEGILSIPPRISVKVAYSRDGDLRKATGERKFIPKPENWGPKPRAKAKPGAAPAGPAPAAEGGKEESGDDDALEAQLNDL